MAEREEYEEVEEVEEQRPVRVRDYSPLTAAQAALHERQLAKAEREETEEQVADDAETLRARREGWQSPYAAPGVPLSPQQANRERALDDAHATDDAETDDEPTRPRRQAATTGRRGETYERMVEDDEYLDWVHETGRVPGADTEAEWRRLRASEREESTGTDDAERAAPADAARPMPAARPDSTPTAAKTDDDEQDDTDDAEQSRISRLGRAGVAAVGSAVADLDRRFAPDDAEREEGQRPAGTVGGWLDDVQASAIAEWSAGTVDGWLESRPSSGKAGWW